MNHRSLKGSAAVARTEGERVVDGVGRFDIVLVGGGLQSALIALCVLDRRPETRIAMIERRWRIGGNHTWSFHAGDVTGDDRALVDALVTYQWPSYEVAFPGARRTLRERYASVSSERRVTWWIRKS